MWGALGAGGSHADGWGGTAQRQAAGTQGGREGGSLQSGAQSHSGNGEGWSHRGNWVHLTCVPNTFT